MNCFCCNKVASGVWGQFSACLQFYLTPSHPLPFLCEMHFNTSTNSVHFLISCNTRSAAFWCLATQVQIKNYQLVMCRMFSFNNYLVVYPVLLLLLLRGGNVRNLDYLEQVWTSCNALCALVQSCWSIGLSKWYRNSFPCFLMDPPPPLFSTPSQLASS